VTVYTLNCVTLLDDMKNITSFAIYCFTIFVA